MMTFNGSSQYLSTTTFPTNRDLGVACTIASWFWPTNTTHGRVAQISTSSGGSVPASILVHYPSAGFVSTQYYGANVLPASTNKVPTDRPSCAVAVNQNGFAYIYLNGVRGDGANGTVASMTGADYFQIGCARTTVYQNYFTGGIGETCVWAAALTDGEAYDVMYGRPMNTVRPGSIVAYYPLGRTGQSHICDTIGGVALTENNSPTWNSGYDSYGTMDAPLAVLLKTLPTRTADIAATLDGLTTSASATFTPPVYTTSVAATLDGIAASASATFTPPVYSATIAATFDGIAATAIGAVVNPTYAATSAVTLDGITAAASATFAPPVYSATVAATIDAITVSIASTFTAPTYAGAVAATLDGITASASATSAPPTYTGMVEATLDGITAAASAMFVAPVFTGAASVTLYAVESSASATFVAPTFTGTVSATLDAVTATAAAAAINPTYTASITAVLDTLVSVVAASVPEQDYHVEVDTLSSSHRRPTCTRATKRTTYSHAHSRMTVSVVA